MYILAKILVFLVPFFSLMQHAKASQLVMVGCVSSGRSVGGSESRPQAEGTQLDIRMSESDAIYASDIYNRISIICKNFNFSEITLPFIRIEGEIKPFMVEFLENLRRGIASSERFNQRISQDLNSIHFSINSEGGDIYTAMRIGRILRKLNAHITVPHGSICYSSCILILASGVDRQVTYSARIGIHRPYFSNLDHRETREQVAARISRAHADMSAYFQEMGQPASLLDAMRAVPPNRIRILNRQEIEMFMLSGEDPTHQERVLARGAYQYGTTSSELRRREELAERMCRTPPRSADSGAMIGFFRCRDAVLYALTEQTLVARQERARVACSPMLRGRALDTLSAADLDRLRECQRNIMVGNSR